MYHKLIFVRAFTIVLFALAFGVSTVCAALPVYLDTTFGSGGKVVTPVTPNDDAAERVRIKSNGKIVTLGYSAQIDGDFSYVSGYFILRHNADGTLDASFGTNGSVIVNLGDSVIAARCLITLTKWRRNSKPCAARTQNIHSRRAVRSPLFSS